MTRTDSCRIVTFTLFPSFITPYRALQRDLEAGQVAATMCSKALGSKSFVHKCAGLIEAELSCSLHWELPISTMVRFNDQGRSLAPPASFSPVRRVLNVRQGNSYSRQRHFQQCGRYLRPLCEAYPRDLPPRHRYRPRGVGTARRGVHPRRTAQTAFRNNDGCFESRRRLVGDASIVAVASDTG